MHHKGMLYLSFVLLVGLFSLWGCPKKSDVTTSTEAQTQTMKADGSDAQTQMMKSKGSNEEAGAMSEGLKPVYFDFNKSFISDDAKAVIKANAEWLKANPKAKIKIEGNCDERENSKALGKRRAASAKKYLTGMGISGRRISLISYGKKKPICNEQDETCWQKNRRDDFVVVGE